MVSYIRKNIYPLHHNHGNHQKQQRRCQTLLPGVHVYQACYSENTTVVEVCEAVQMRIQLQGSPTTMTKVRPMWPMKEQATNTRDKPSQIFAQVVANCKDDVQTIMPLEENWKRTMRYHRPTPPVPHSLADMTITEIYSVSAEKIINDGFSYSENV